MANNRTSKGSGRTKGAFSFVQITLAELNAKFNDQTTPIKVSRLWAQEVGFKNLVTKAAGDLTADTQGLLPSTKVGAVVTALD